MPRPLAAIWQRLRDAQRQRIYILPTRVGYAYAGLLLLMLLGAINYSNSLGHLLCFLLASLGQVAMHHSHRNLRHLSVSVTPLSPVFCGQPAQFRLNINNDDNRDRYQLDVAIKKANSRSRWQFLGSYDSLHLISAIEAENSSACTLDIPTHVRGMTALPPLKLSSHFPLGLFTCWSVYSRDARVMVYPEPRGSRTLPLPPTGTLTGLNRERPGDDDFSGLRNYRPGDTLHRIAWKAVARDDVMRSKQFASQEGSEVLLSWYELSDIDDIEARLSQLCQWVIESEQNGHRYGLVLPTERVAPDHGVSHQHHCLKMLALYHG